MLRVDGDVDALAESCAPGSPPPALGLAALPRRRKLRHDARRGARRQAAGRGRRPLRPDPRLLRDGSAEHRLRAAQRPAVCAVPARVRQRRAVPRQAQGRARQVAGRRRARRPRPSSPRNTSPRCTRASRLDGKRRGRIVNRIAELTGLAPALVDEKNLRISDHDVLLRAAARRGPIVGRLDARVTGPMAASRTRDWEFDPGHRGDRRAVHDGGARLHERAARRDTPARYEVLSMEAHKQLELEPRRGQGQQLRDAPAAIWRARCAAIRI